MAPDIFPIEVGNALTRGERKGRATTDRSAGLFGDPPTYLPILLASLPLLTRAHAISSRFRVGFYGRVYVALAGREACPFVTADNRRVRSLGSTFPFIRPYDPGP